MEVEPQEILPPRSDPYAEAIAEDHLRRMQQIEAEQAAQE